MKTRPRRPTGRRVSWAPGRGGEYGRDAQRLTVFRNAPPRRAPPGESLRVFGTRRAIKKTTPGVGREGKRRTGGQRPVADKTPPMRGNPEGMPGATERGATPRRLGARRTRHRTLPFHASDTGTCRANRSHSRALHDRDRDPEGSGRRRRQYPQAIGFRGNGEPTRDIAHRIIAMDYTRSHRIPRRFPCGKRHRMCPSPQSSSIQKIHGLKRHCSDKQFKILRESNCPSTCQRRRTVWGAEDTDTDACASPSRQQDEPTSLCR